MSEADIFSKLSRILETHTFEDQEPDVDFEQLLNTSSSLNQSNNYYPQQSFYNSSNKLETTDDSGRKPTPFEVWRAKQQNSGKIKETPKLNPHEWDRLVDRMHQTNRVKHSAMVREQNQGLALELGGHEFKPRMNPKSLELASTMKSLSVRMPEMLEKKKSREKHSLEAKLVEEVAECSFHPNIIATKSEVYLKKMGRLAPRTPDDLMRYKDEKIRRNIQRKQIVEEVESKELTFHPQLPLKSALLKEKLEQSNMLQRDPVTRVTSAKPRKQEALAQEMQYKGAALTIDSDHPYKHNTNEYIAVAVPGAIGYSISFSEKTATESIHDYIKFFKDDTHTDFWGCGKYSGGMDGSAANWPGQNGRPPLSIPAPKFVLHFKTNGSLNDWGFQMVVEPILTSDKSAASFSASATSQTPEITAFGKAYTKHTAEPIHDRLYRQGLEKQIETINTQAELFQEKIKVPLRPWESARNVEEGINAQTSWTSNKTHLVKQANAPIIEEMVVDDDEDMPVTVIEFDSNLNFLWKALRQCETIPLNMVVPADEEFDANAANTRQSDL